MNTTQSFNESQWLKLIYLLADTQQWIDDMCKQAFLPLPLTNKKKLFTRHYYLTPAALVHITERHYYKTSRHPQCSKFSIPLIEILHLLRLAGEVEPQPVPGNSNTYRTLRTDEVVGFDSNYNPVTRLTVITCPAGRIITAFPGSIVQV